VIARGSIFDPGYAGRLERSAFLRTLSQRLARPVMPDDEAFAYLATQAVADYLSTDREKRLDGIIYPSVQVGALAQNVVLFHKAARVETLSIPEGTEISASLYSHDEDESPDYSVIEQTPPEQPIQEGGGSRSSLGVFGRPLASDFQRGDWREKTLRVDAEAIHVHHIQAVEIKTSASRVLRHRWEKRNSDF
jgi:hypothetical protein